MSLRRTAFRIALLCALVPAATQAAPRGPKRPKVAVMEIKALYGDAQLDALLSEVALTEAASFKGLDTVGRSDIQALLGLEQQRQLLGCSEDASCLAEVGGALGVDYLLVGTVGRIGKMLRLDLKLVDAKKARAVGRVGTSLEGKAEALVTATQDGVRALLREITPDAPLPPVVRSGRPSRWPVWAVLGVGGATLAAGITTTVMASSQYRALEASQTEVGYAASYDSKSARIRRLSLLSDVLVPVGAVTTGLGGWLWWRTRPPPAVKVGVAAAPGGGAVLLTGDF